MATAPILSLPAPDQPIAPGLAYVKKTSAERQAGYWREVLAGDPLYEDCGYTVGVRKDGARWALVWVSTTE